MLQCGSILKGEHEMVRYVCRLALVILGLLACAPVHAEEVVISLDGDSVPVIATIIGPQSLLDRAAQVAKLRDDTCEIRQIFIGESFSVDWGDQGRYYTQVAPPILGPDGCVDWLKHRYTVPGTYLVRAGLHHLGPTDMPISDWQSERRVTVGGIAAPLEFSLVDTATGRTVLYQSPLTVEWQLATGSPAELKLELVGENGAVAVTRTLTGLAYVGRGQTTLRLQGPAYDALVRPDNVKALIRATLTSGGQTIVRESGTMTLSSEIVFSNPDTAPRAEPVAGQPRTITFSHHTYYRECHSYEIDWGDGSPAERSIVDRIPNACTLESILVRSTHSYVEAGTYRITLRVNDFSFQGPPEDSPFYQAVTVTVP
mgnify:CR=1 FL=1